MRVISLFLFLAIFVHGQLKAQTKGPMLEFKETYHDFGDIQQGEIVDFKFEFTNTGDSILLVQKVFSTCGCTIPEWPKEGIEAGKSAFILVKYNSDGKMGLQNKIITLFSNAKNVPEEVPQRLSIRVNVLPKK
jgi:phosphoribosylaminoimidazole-succinocarboxamide synthase